MRSEVKGRPPGHTAAYAETRERILDVATRLFAEGGYDATGLRGIADVVGLTGPALYHYFASKEALMDALIDRATEGPRAGVRAAGGGDLRDLLLALGGGYFRGAARPEAKQALEVVFLAAHRRPEWAERYLGGLVDPTEEGAAAAIARVLPAGARGRIDPRWLVKQLIGSLLSFVLHEEVLRRGGANSPDREAYLAQVVDVIAAGVERLAAAPGPG